ncbi:hypothetical protein GCM10023107_26270 [Actinoplanes octamycinicus]|nr:hypothetical protein Aoc01nite_56660 [Actinoplanes octamycinicus]
MFADTDNGGGTDWSMQSVPQMWSMLQNQDGTAHKSLLVTWKKSADLLVDHLSRVKNYRDNLAEAWPPQRSAASAKYLDRLDDLIKHLSDTYHATVQNHHALGAATSALVSARQKINTIYQEYMANQQALDAFAVKQQSAPETLSKWRPISLSPSAAVESRQLDLQLQAQSVMSTLSTDLAQAQLNITTPNLYDPGSSTREEDKNKRERSSGSPLPHGKHSLQNGMTAAPSDWSPAPSAGDDTNSSEYHQSPNGSKSAIRNSEQLQNTPIFAGTPSSSSKAPTTVAQIAPIEGQIPISPISEVIAPPPTYPPPSSMRATLPTSPLGPLQPGSHQEPSGRAARPVPPGGIIGTNPGVNSTPPNRAGTQRVNPVGGLIGQTASPPPVTSRRSSPKDHDPTRRERDSWDLDNPWQVDEGMPPVILPPKKQEIDPGPAIGL